MKKHYFPFLLFLLMLCHSSKAQDTIILKTGNIIIGKVTKIGESEIEYKNIGNMEGPSYAINRNKVSGIQYQNGQMDIIDSYSLGVYKKNKINKLSLKKDSIAKKSIKPEIISELKFQIW